MPTPDRLLASSFAGRAAKSVQAGLDDDGLLGCPIATELSAMPGDVVGKSRWGIREPPLDLVGRGRPTKRPYKARRNALLLHGSLRQDGR